MTRSPSEGPSGPRVVVVTGASSGIGRATALALARRGETVVLVARAEASLRRAAHECEALGARTLVVPADVRDAEAVQRVLTRTLAAFGTLDAWVHTAAVVAYGRVEDVPAEVFDHVVATNLLGTVNVARAVLPHFRRRESGTLVIVGSLLDKTVTPKMGAYVSSKWAVRGLTRILQIETRDAPGVHVCSVAPAGVDTPIYLQAANYAGFVGRPPPPIDPPEKVARAILSRLDRPRRRVRVVGPASRVVQLGFTLTPALYDAVVTPLVDLSALSRRRVEPHPGNVIDARPAGDHLHGRWGRHWLRPAGAALVGSGLAAGALGVRAAARRA